MPPVNISNIGIKGSDPGDFAETNNCGSSVPAGGSCTIKVTFPPQATGQRSASLAVSDDGGGSPQNVALTRRISSDGDVVARPEGQPSSALTLHRARGQSQLPRCGRGRTGSGH